MNRLLKIALTLVAGLVTLIGGASLYACSALPRVSEPRELAVSKTPERVERGRYLANHVAVCTDCHSERDWSKLAGPIKDGTFARGGEPFNHDIGIPGDLESANITPAGIGAWTDGELERMITTGVTRDGRAVFPIMPYQNYADACQDDVESIIAYLRTLQPVEHTPKPAELDFPVNLIINTIPEEKPRPDCSEPHGSEVQRGEYLVNMAACTTCHTQVDGQGNLIAGTELGGGREFKMPRGGVVRSANLTPHETGLKAWDRDSFIARFRGFADAHALPAVKPGEFNTIMPWNMYAGMTDEDLGAIYSYLRTVKPLDNVVEKWSPPDA
jgi:mono/diheme cytochrome c family protein